MSGTFTSITAAMCDPPTLGMPNVLYGPRIRPFGVESVLLDRLGHDLRLDLAVVGECLQRRDRDVVAIDLEEFPKLDAVIAAAEAIGAKRHIAPRNLVADLV